MARSMSPSSCLALPSQLRSLSLNPSSSSSSSRNQVSFPSLGFSSNLSLNVFSKGWLSMGTAKRGMTVVCEAAPTKKPDSAVKRARQAEKRRIYNKSRKSEIKTRMKKVLQELVELKKKTDAQFEEILPIEQLIGEAYSVIDKAIRVGTLHRNTGARRNLDLLEEKNLWKSTMGGIPLLLLQPQVLELLAVLFVPYRQEELADGFDLPLRKMEELSARIFLPLKRF